MRSRPVLSVPLQALALLAATATATRYLYGLADGAWARLDLHDPLGWLARTPAEDAVAELLRLAALAGCWWLTVSLVLAVLVRALRWRPAVHVLDRATLPSVRRFADRIAGGSLVVATLGGGAAPALAEPTPAVVTVSESGLLPPGALPPGPVAEGVGPRDGARPDDDLVGVPVTSTEHRAAEHPATQRPVTKRPASERPATKRPASEQPAPGAPAPEGVGPIPLAPEAPAATPGGTGRLAPPAVGAGSRHVVARPGDHLWAIARAEVARTTGRTPAHLRAADIAPYWREVVAANRDRLRSGEPDLLFPGERIVLPEVRP